MVSSCWLHPCQATASDFQDGFEMPGENIAIRNLVDDGDRFYGLVLGKALK